MKRSFRYGLGAVCVLTIATAGGCVDDTDVVGSNRAQLSVGVDGKEHWNTPIWTIDDEFARISREEVPGFGGHYVNESGNSVVYLTDFSQRSAAEKYVNTLRSTHKWPATSIVFRQGKYDFAQLKQWRDAVNTLMSQRELILLDIDETSNEILLGVEGNPDNIRRLVIGLGVPDSAFRIRSERYPDFRDSLKQTTRPVVGGLETINAVVSECTIGFNAQRTDSTKVFVTASHCSETYMGSDGSIQYQRSRVVGDRIGVEVQDFTLYSCDGGPNYCRYSDAAMFAYDDDADWVAAKIAHPTFYTVGGPGSQTINASSPRLTYVAENNSTTSMVGTWISKVGRTTGYTRGQITNSCTTITVFRCQYIASLYSAGGDSGSPIFVNGPNTEVPDNGFIQLHGLLWGGPPDDLTVTYYSNIQGIRKDLGSFRTCFMPGFFGLGFCPWNP